MQRARRQTKRLHGRVLATAAAVVLRVGGMGLGFDFGNGNDPFTCDGTVLWRPGTQAYYGEILRKPRFLEVEGQPEARYALVLHHAFGQHALSAGSKTISRCYQRAGRQRVGPHRLSASVKQLVAVDELVQKRFRNPPNLLQEHPLVGPGS